MSDFHPALNLVQWLFDATDAINFAEYILHRIPEGEARPHFFHIVGLGDNYAPETTQETLAVGTGAYLVEPAPSPFAGVNTTTLPASGNFAGTTALVRQYEPAEGEDGHFVVFRDAQAQADVASFMGSLIIDGIPTVD